MLKALYNVVRPYFPGRQTARAFVRRRTARPAAPGRRAVEAFDKILAGHGPARRELRTQRWWAMNGVTVLVINVIGTDIRPMTA